MQRLPCTPSKVTDKSCTAVLLKKNLNAAAVAHTHYYSCTAIFMFLQCSVRKDLFANQLPQILTFSFRPVSQVLSYSCYFISEMSTFASVTKCSCLPGPGVIAAHRITASSPDTDLPTVSGLRVRR